MGGSKSHEPLSSSQELKLFADAKSEDKEARYKAREILIHSQLRQVLAIARRFPFPSGLEDIIQEGNLALIHAVDNYGINGYSNNTCARLNSVAYRYILNGIKHYLKQQNRNSRRLLTCASSIHEDKRQPITYKKPEDDLANNEIKSLLPNLLNSLDPREKFIIKSHFGIGQEKKTLKEIGAQLDLSKERIRQIQKDALKKLRVQLDNHV